MLGEELGELVEDRIPRQCEVSFIRTRTYALNGSASSDRNRVAAKGGNQTVYFMFTHTIGESSRYKRDPCPRWTQPYPGIWYLDNSDDVGRKHFRHRVTWPQGTHMDDNSFSRFDV